MASTTDTAAHPDLFRPFWLTWPEVQRVIHAFEQANVRLFFYGGALRDAIVGVEPVDIDVVADAHPERILALLHSAGIAARLMSRPHKVEARINSIVFDITHDLSSDDVPILDRLRHHAATVDFNLNTLSLAPSGELFDFFGARDDISNRRLRFMRPVLESLDVDPYLIIRYFRFLACFGQGPPDPEVVAACEAYKHRLFTSRSIRYSAQHLLHLLAAKAPHAALTELHRLAILDDIFCLRIESVAPIAALQSLEELSGATPDRHVRLASLLTTTCLPASVTLTHLAQLWNLPETSILRLNSLLRLAPLLNPPVSPQVRHQIACVAGAVDFLQLILLRCAMEDDPVQAQSLYHALMSDCGSRQLHSAPDTVHSVDSVCRLFTTNDWGND